MDFWLAIVLIVIVTSGFETYRQYLKRKDRGKTASDEELRKFREIIAKQDERISNLETVILNLEKERKFENLD